MGLGNESYKFLLTAAAFGFYGKDICTLGRQSCGMSVQLFDDLCKTYSTHHCEYPDKAHYFADDLLAPIGFNVDSMDASPYEGASIVHDLNVPVPVSLHDRYDLVWDGGTLEHVFNFPAALQNAMHMVRVGGHLFLETPANNQCGHGFYQFSPELFFRVFTPANGFELLRIYIQGGDKLYHVVDPQDVHGRVELVNSAGTLLRVHARKIAGRNLSSIQQSDYAETWSASTQPAPLVDGPLKAFARKHLNARQTNLLSRKIREFKQRRFISRWRKQSKLSNRSFYVPVTDWTKTSGQQIAEYNGKTAGKKPS